MSTIERNRLGSCLRNGLRRSTRTCVARSHWRSRSNQRPWLRIMRSGCHDSIFEPPIKLTKKDSGEGSHEGHHHFIDNGLIVRVEGDKVRLSANEDVAVTMEDIKLKDKKKSPGLVDGPLLRVPRQVSVSAYRCIDAARTETCAASEYPHYRFVFLAAYDQPDARPLPQERYRGRRCSGGGSV